MADPKKLSQLTTATPATGDLLYMVDVSDTTDGPAGSSRKATVSDVLALKELDDDTVIGTLSNNSNPLILLTKATFPSVLRSFSLGAIQQSILTAEDAAAVRDALGFPANPPSDGQDYRLVINNGSMSWVIDV